jgi:hypothetical protein
MRSSWRLFFVLGALVLGGLAGAYIGEEHVGLCVDRVSSNSSSTAEVRLSPPGAAVGAVLVGAGFLMTRRWTRHG